MASGTQGYEITSGDLTEALWNRWRKRKGDKDTKKSVGPVGKGGPLAPTGGGGGGVVPASVSVVTPNQKLLVSGKVDSLGAGSSALVANGGGALAKYDEKLVAVNVQVLEEQKKQTRLIAAQTQLLALIPGKKGGALSKYKDQEDALEQVEDLSDTQGYSRAKRKRPGWLDFLFGLLKAIGKGIKAIVPALSKFLLNKMLKRMLAQQAANALKNTASMCACSAASMPAVIPARVRDLGRTTRALPPASAVRGALPPARSARPALPAAVSPSAKLLPERTSGTALAVRTTSGQKALPPGQGQAFNPQVQAKTKVLEPLEIGRVDTSKADPRALRPRSGDGQSQIDRLLNQARDQSLPRETQEKAVASLRRKNVDIEVKAPTVRPQTPAIPNKATSNAAGAISDAAKLADTGGAAKYLVPGASAITAGLSIMAGDYAGAIVDAADATGDAIMVSGATGTAAAVGSALTAGAAVITAGITSSYVGEMTRGVGDWIRGDGNNMAMNMVSGIVEGLSGALETIGAPFRAIFEYFNSGFNIEKSNEVMAEIDSNLRESFRQGLNMFDVIPGLNLISDEKGGFGTLGLYGDAAKRADAKMRGEGDVKNSAGGSYFLDNPSNFGPFQGGEAGGEVVTFTPFGGQKLVSEMGTHMATALEQPFKFAIGGIAVAIQEVIKILGPIGQIMGPAVKPILDKLIKISGVTNLQISGITGGALSQLGGMMNGPGGMMNNMFQGLSGNYQRLMRSMGLSRMPGVTPGATPYTGQTNEGDFSAVLPQGAPQFNSGFGKRNLGYGSRDHRGIDIGVDRGSPVLSMEKGTVSHIIPDFMHGSAVVVTSDEGNATLYGHVDPTVAQGDAVNKGDKIATVKYWRGTGNMAADNTHLHLERHPGGYGGRATAVDPLQFTKGKSRVKNAELKAAQNNAPNVAPPNNTTASVMLPRIQAAAKETPELAALAKVMEFNQATQQRQAAQAQQNSGGGLGPNPFVMPLTDKNTDSLAPLNLYRLTK